MSGLDWWNQENIADLLRSMAMARLAVAYSDPHNALADIDNDIWRITGGQAVKNLTPDELVSLLTEAWLKAGAADGMATALRVTRSFIQKQAINNPDATLTLKLIDASLSLHEQAKKPHSNPETMPSSSSSPSNTEDSPDRTMAKPS
jgi:hypothetical protein